MNFSDIKKNRGYFKIGDHILETIELSLLKKVFENCIIVGVHYDMDEGMSTYSAHSELFDEVERHNIPEYQVIINDDVVNFKRLP